MQRPMQTSMQTSLKPVRLSRESTSNTAAYAIVQSLVVVELQSGVRYLEFVLEFWRFGVFKQFI
jgi:hypothetical protein